MKRIISLALIGTMCLSLCACGTKKTADTSSAAEGNSEVIDTVSEVSEEESTTVESDSMDNSNDISELEALGDVDVDQGIFDVTLTIPADFAEGTTQEELDAEVAERGYKSATLNDDGSVTFVMTKSQHSEMMEGITESIESDFSDMVGSEDYPNITAIDHNEDFTKITVTTTSEELTMDESFASIVFMMYGSMYNIFNGTSEGRTYYLDYVNADTGEILYSENSADTANAAE